MPDSPTKIFISYARDESHGQSLATAVQQQLLGAGFDVFRDVIGLKPGDVWYHKLEFELESSDLMVLVISEKVRKSKWVHNEFSMAEELGIPVIPVLAEKIRYPLWLRHLQVLDYCGERDWSLLLSAVSGHCEIPSVSPLSKGSTLPQVPQSAGAHPPLQKGERGGFPAWASDGGTDQYGQYADLTIEGVTQRFRLIKAGKFLMGSPEDEPEREVFGRDETQHEVILTKDYWLADTTCTQAFWQAVTGNNPARFQNNPSNPVESVSWDDVQTFIKTLNQKYSGLQLRLPTEAEWEYACRAGTTTPFSFGESITPDRVNYDCNVEQAVPVKSLPENKFGLYEMHGNVFEWCNDWLGTYPAAQQPVRDPKGAQSGSLRVLRGGAWLGHGSYCRSAARLAGDPDSNDRNNFVGFRLARGH